MDPAKPAWKSTELPISALCGYGIFELANGDTVTIEAALLRAVACLSLAWIAGRSPRRQ